ncbi:GAF and ANTAR domain-containing protein [Amycolatopsis sp. CA-230715]|uniref:GAF and ANTAR domain-containing protein n=1 Tax=Amycolatopsis sp. CA-230715 TaxID=2745196 RepID=UPI001C01B421|nr:GAF and ANTAR domain-containing protein [Amycolatopsis sp. CA-230715]
MSEHARRQGGTVSVEIVCDTAASALRVTGAGLLVGTGSGGLMELRYSSAPLSARLADIEATVGEGPASDAWRERAPVLVSDLDDLAAARRWPLYTASAVEAGSRAVFALPLVVGAVKVGVLTLCRREPRPLEAAELTDALVFGEIVMMLVLDEYAGVPNADSGPPGSTFTLSDPRVHQAAGMIAARLDLTLDDAYARLRARAFADRRTLSEVAADVVGRVLRFDIEKGAG